jgi:folate-binding protein YgfZ
MRDQTETTPEGEPLQHYEQVRAGCGLFERSALGKIEVAGPDARTFLHNLSTNDVRNMPPGTVCEAFLCTATAKVVAYIRIACLTPSDAKSAVFRLETAAGANEKVFQHLDRYLISEDVELTDRTHALSQVHLAGPTAADVLSRALGGDAPALRRQMMGTIGGVPVDVRRDDLLGLPGFDVLWAADQGAAVRHTLLGLGGAFVGPEAFEMLRIEAGTPAAGVDVDETTFAPEAGRIEQAISYTKGCYLGQEPIVMARDRGQINRRLMGLKLAEPAAHGSLVYRDAKEVGRVTSSARSPRLATALALAYLRRSSWEPGLTVEVETEGRRLAAQTSQLPF